MLLQVTFTGRLPLNFTMRTEYMVMVNIWVLYEANKEIIVIVAFLLVQGRTGCGNRIRVTGTEVL